MILKKSVTSQHFTIFLQMDDDSDFLGNVLDMISIIEISTP